MRDIMQAAARGPRGIREILFQHAGLTDPVTATEAVEVDLQRVMAKTVVMDRCGAEEIHADEVTMERSGARTIETTSVRLEQSGVVALGSDRAELDHSSAVQVVADHAQVSGGTVGLLIAERAELTNSPVLVFAGQAEGDVRALFTAKTAAVFGAALGAVFALVTMVLRRD
jgi:hypothetical protein